MAMSAAESAVLGAGARLRTGQVAESVGLSAPEARAQLRASDLVRETGRGWWGPSDSARLAAVSSPKPTSRREFGVTGTEIFGGLLGDTDYVAEMRPPGVYDLYDKMRLSDGTVRGGLEAIKQPLISAAWYVGPGGDSAEDQEVAELVEENLLGTGGMSTSWDDTLRNVLLFLDYGCMPMEPVWEVRDWRGSPKVWLRKLAPRLPKTITEWRLDKHGGLEGVKQEVGHQDGTSSVFEIPRDKLLLFVHQQEASNFRGHSILRAARKHWEYKRRLENVDAMGITKRNHGIDVGTLINAGDEAKSQAEKVLMTTTSHEKNFVVEQDELFKYRIQGIEGQVLEALPSIDYHDRMILRSMMAEFVALGSGTGQGSFAMHKDKSSLFMLALQGIAKIITNAVNAYLIPTWVRMNYTVDRMPRLAHKRLDTREAAAVANAVAALTNSGTIRNTPRLEAAVLELLDLPEPADGEEAIEPPGDPKPPRREGEESSSRLSRSDAVRRAIDDAERSGVDVSLARRAAHLFHRAPRGVEYHVDFAAMDDEIASSKARLVRSAERLQREVVDAVAGQVEDAFTSGTVADLTPDRLQVPDVSLSLGEVAGELSRVIERGKAEVRRELRRQGATEATLSAAQLRRQAARLAITEPIEPDTPAADAFVTARARQFLDTVVSRVRNVAAARALDAAQAGKLGGTVRATLEGLAGSILASEAGKLVTKALAIGRRAEQDEMSPAADHAVYSALLDGNTCDHCRAVDDADRTYQVGSAEYLDHYPPLDSSASGSCRGYPRCRCMMVLVLRDELAG